MIEKDFSKNLFQSQLKIFYKLYLRNENIFYKIHFNPVVKI